MTEYDENAEGIEALESTLNETQPRRRRKPVLIEHLHAGIDLHARPFHPSDFGFFDAPIGATTESWQREPGANR